MSGDDEVVAEKEGLKRRRNCYSLRPHANILGQDICRIRVEREKGREWGRGH
jgi:hypothetical protein